MTQDEVREMLSEVLCYFDYDAWAELFDEDLQTDDSIEELADLLEVMAKHLEQAGIEVTE